SQQRWSFPALRTRQHAPVPRWPQLLLMPQVSVPYLLAPSSKINPVLLSGEPLQSWLWADLPPRAFPALAVATIASELFLAIGFWIPRVRVLAAVAGLGLHAGILVGLSDQTLVLAAFAAASFSVYWLFLSRPSLSAI